MNNTLKMIALSIVLALPATMPILAHAKPAEGSRGAMKGGMKGERRGEGRAEGRGRRRGNPMARMMRMASGELGLSATQKTRVTALTKEFEAGRRSISGNKALSPEQKRAQMKPMRTAFENRFKAILTPAQRAKLPAMMAKMRTQMRERRKGQGERMAGRRGENRNGENRKAAPKPR